MSAFSGGLLAAIRDNTKDKIEEQQLLFVKGPALKAIFATASNDPIADRFKLKDGDAERSFFVGIMDGKPCVAMESYGKGYGGDVGLMVGIDLESDTVIGASVTTHSETPGMGARAKSEPEFTRITSYNVCYTKLLRDPDSLYRLHPPDCVRLPHGYHGHECLHSPAFRQWLGSGMRPFCPETEGAAVLWVAVPSAPASFP